MRPISRTEVERRVDEGELLVVHHGYVLKVDSWIDVHPGGDKAVFQMVGRDASDEMDVYHGAETLNLMKAFRIGKVADSDLPWDAITPPIQREHNVKRRIPTAAEQASVDAWVAKKLEHDRKKYPDVSQEVQERIKAKFRELHETMFRENLYQCTYWGYLREFTRISALMMLAYYFFRPENMVLLFISAVCLGLAWHQAVFIAHDAGHHAITHNYWIDNLAGSFIASYIGGLSLGWWKRNHNIHHIVTNDPVNDPDIQHLPFFAVSARFLLGNIYSTYYERVLQYDWIAKVFIPIQHYMYYPILCFGRFNLYRLSLEHLILGLGPRKGKATLLRWFELVGLSVFVYWYFYLVVYKSLHTRAQRWMYVMISHIFTMPVHVQITLSHFAMSTSNMGLNESFAQRQLRTSMDVACPAWFDFVHGGLQFQAIHHLFPRLPRHNLRDAQPYVIKFAEEMGLHYTIFGFVHGNQHVIDRLYDVALQARILKACNDFCRREITEGTLNAYEAQQKLLCYTSSSRCI